MKVVKEKKGFKEFLRKFIVSLKKRTNRIPQFVMVVAFIVYSISLSNISNTTGYINKTPMGLCTFVTMLFSVLAFVCSLNAFPPRAKPKIFMVILMYTMQVLIIGADVWYIIKIEEGLAASTFREVVLEVIDKAETVMIVHSVLVGVTVVLFAIVPVIRKLLNKINTSVDLGENEEMQKIELEDE